MFLEISKHLFRPHPSAVIAQGQGGIRQVGRQTPRFFFTNLPVDQGSDRMDLGLGQAGVWRPSGLSSLLNELLHSLPAYLFIDPQTCIAFLSQDKEPAPLFQVPQDCD